MDQRPEKPRAESLYLLALIALLLLRLLLAAKIYQKPSEAFWLDSAEYDALAAGLSQGSAYSGKPTDPVELFRTPGYPAFLALIYASLGYYYGHVALVQLMLGAAACLLLFDILRRAASPAFAFLMCAIYALDPSSTFWATTIMAESLFTFLVVTAMYCLWRWWGGGSHYWAALGGLLAGLSALVRPIGQLLLPLWSGIVLLRMVLIRSGKSERWAPRRTRMHWGGFGFVITLAMVLAPYALYNLRVWGIFTLSSVDTFNLGRYHAAPLLMEAQGISLEQSLRDLEVSYRPDEHDRARYWQVIGRYPLAYARRFAAGDLVVLFWPEYHRWFSLFDIGFETRGALEQLQAGRVWQAVQLLAGYLDDQPLTGIALAVTVSYQLGLYVMASLGLLGYLRSEGRDRNGVLWALLLALTALILLLTPGPVAEQRFRVPAQPALILLAGYLSGAPRTTKPEGSAA